MCGRPSPWWQWGQEPHSTRHIFLVLRSCCLTLICTVCVTCNVSPFDMYSLRKKRLPENEPHSRILYTMSLRNTVIIFFLVSVGGNRRETQVFKYIYICLSQFYEKKCLLKFIYWNIYMYQNMYVGIFLRILLSGPKVCMCRKMYSRSGIIVIVAYP